MASSDDEFLNVEEVKSEEEATVEKPEEEEEEKSPEEEEKSPEEEEKPPEEEEKSPEEEEPTTVVDEEEVENPQEPEQAELEAAESEYQIEAGQEEPAESFEAEPQQEAPTEDEEQVSEEIEKEEMIEEKIKQEEESPEEIKEVEPIEQEQEQEEQEEKGEEQKEEEQKEEEQKEEEQKEEEQKEEEQKEEEEKEEEQKEEQKEEEQKEEEQKELELETEQEQIYEEAEEAAEEEKEPSIEEQEQEKEQEEETTAAEVFPQDEVTEGYDVASDRQFDAFEDAQSAVLDTEEGEIFRKFQPCGEPEGEEEPLVSPEPLLGTVDLTDVTLKPSEELPTTTVIKDRESMDFMEETFWEPRRRDRTIFSERCQRGDYPFRLVQTPQGVTLEWVLAVKDLDYRYYLPEFIRGLKEPDARFLAIANLCVHDMIATDKTKVKMALPYIMNDLYEALSSRYPAICINTCKVLQKLAKVVGKQLGFYFDRLFGILNTMRLRIEYVEGQKSFIKHRDMSLHPLYEEILTTWCRLQDILSRLHEKELQRMMRYWIRPLPWLTF